MATTILGFMATMAMVHTIGAPACGAGTILGDTATIRAGTTHGLIHGIMAMPDGMAAGTTHGIMAGVAGMALGTGVVR